MTMPDGAPTCCSSLGACIQDLSSTVPGAAWASRCSQFILVNLTNSRFPSHSGSLRSWKPFTNLGQKGQATCYIAYLYKVKGLELRFIKT